jgi:methylase of polypeptide subunit release factors
LAAKVAPGEVVGVDISPDAVGAAQADPSRPANLNYEVGDVYALAHPESA